MISFNRPDGQSVQGYLLECPGATAAVVVIQEWWGLNDQIRRASTAWPQPDSPPWRSTSTAARARSRPRKPTT